MTSAAGSALSGVTDKATDAVKDVSKEAVMAVVETISAGAATLLESASVKLFGFAAGAFLTPVTTGVSAQQYTDSVKQVQADVGQIVFDLNHVQGNDLVTVQRDRDKLQAEVDRMNSFEAAMVDERSLGPYACYSVVGANNGVINARVAVLLSLLPNHPEYSKQAPNKPPGPSPHAVLP